LTQVRAPQEGTPQIGIPEIGVQQYRSTQCSPDEGVSPNLEERLAGYLVTDDDHAES
jgi:hypothetical protein